MTTLDTNPTHDLLTRAWRQGGDHLRCYTGTSRDVRGHPIHAESFTAMVIADLLLDVAEYGPLCASIRSMVLRELRLGGGVLHFFKEHERIPADADCTALGLSVLLRGGRVDHLAHAAFERLLANSDARGVVHTYLDPSEDRAGIVDAVVCANVACLGFQLGREGELRGTLDTVLATLHHDAFLQGTRYYPSPDAFLYFVGRIPRFAPRTASVLRAPLRRAVRLRQGTTAYTIDLAQRVLLSAWLDTDDAGEGERLLALREAGGTWATDALFRYGRREIYFGSPALASAFAVAATVASP